MDQELKAQWVAALRSGNFTQGKYFLKNTDGGMTRYCCLGVLCEIAGLPTGEHNADFESKEYEDLRNTAHLSWQTVKDLSRMNDSVNDEGRSFAGIADYIEENL